MLSACTNMMSHQWRARDVRQWEWPVLHVSTHRVGPGFFSTWYDSFLKDWHEWHPDLSSLATSSLLFLCIWLHLKCYFVCSHNEQRELGRARYMFGHTAEHQAFQPHPSVARHRNEIVAIGALCSSRLFCQLDNRF